MQTNHTIHHDTMYLPRNLYRMEEICHICNRLSKTKRRHPRAIYFHPTYRGGRPDYLYHIHKHDNKNTE